MTMTPSSQPCSHSDYPWLIRQVEADKWPLLYAGVWLSKASVLDILARYEAAVPMPVCADCGRDLPADGYCTCANQEVYDRSRSS